MIDDEKERKRNQMDHLPAAFGSFACSYSRFLISDSVLWSTYNFSIIQLFSYFGKMTNFCFWWYTGRGNDQKKQNDQKFYQMTKFSVK